MNTEELGYRVGEAHQGKGYATWGIGQVVEKAQLDHQLHRLEAGTSDQNIGSQVALVKNGFRFTGRQSQYIYSGGAWQDSITFEKILAGERTK